MKAIEWRAYGGPEVLEYGEVEKPFPTDSEILIKIRATTVLAGDCEVRRMYVHNALLWLPIRIMFGFTKPRKGKRLGQELAGTVEAIGKDVRNFKVGDAVFGTAGIRMSTYAEYIVLPEKQPLGIIPENMSFKEVAGVGIGATNALHFLRLANIQAGEKVLIYGSTGSIGVYAVQLARHYGAEVHAVCPGVHSDLVKSLGATKTLDYLADDFDTEETYGGETYDVIFDTIGKSSFSRSLKSLKKNGRFMHANPTFLEMLKAALPKGDGRKVSYAFAAENTEDLNFLKDLIEKGKLTSVIDPHKFTLEQIPEAHTYVEKGTKLGNVVISVE